MKGIKGQQEKAKEIQEEKVGKLNIAEDEGTESGTKREKGKGNGYEDGN